MKIDLSNKIAVVTGATGELGRVMARTLASCGAGVVIHYLRNADGAEALCREIQAGSTRAMTVQGDITDRSAVFQMKEQIESAWGAPDIIVNNAVIQYPWTSVLEQSANDFEGQFRSSVLHNVFMVQAFVPAMVAKNRGRVIGINTECAMQNAPSQSAYVAGKRGMDGVLRVLAKEVGQHGITVNQVAPGWTISDKYRDGESTVQEDYAKNVPLRRRGTDQEIANVVAFLASDLASFITGAYIPVCGGNVMPAI